MPIKIEYKSEQEVRDIKFTGLISYSDVIDETYKLLNDKGLTLSGTVFKPNASGDTVTAIFIINPTSNVVDPDLTMCIVWTHSYHKGIRFQCNVAGIDSNGSLLLRDKSGLQKARRSSDVSKYKMEIFDDLSLEIKYIESSFESLTSFKNRLKSTKANLGASAVALGLLYVEEDILTTSQSSIIKDMLKSNEINDGWDVYSCFSEGLKDSHPKTLLQDHINMQGFFEEVFLEEEKKQPQAEIVPEKGVTASNEIKEKYNYVSPMPSIIFV